MYVESRKVSTFDDMMSLIYVIVSSRLCLKIACDTFCLWKLVIRQAGCKRRNLQSVLAPLVLCIEEASQVKMGEVGHHNRLRRSMLLQRLVTC